MSIAQGLRRTLGVAAATTALALAGAGAVQAVPYPQPAPVSPEDYLVGDAVYFSMGELSCSIKANGDTGCDFPGGQRLSSAPFLSVPDLVIDVPWLPAHPEFGLTGQHGRAGSRQLGSDAKIGYAGATCSTGFHGSWTCTAKGHSFSGWSGNVTFS